MKKVKRQPKPSTSGQNKPAEAGWTWRAYAAIAAVVTGLIAVLGGIASLIKNIEGIGGAANTVLNWAKPLPSRLTLRDIDVKAAVYVDPNFRLDTVGAWTYRILAVGEKEGSAALTGCFGQMKWGQDWFRSIQNEEFPIYEFPGGAVQTQLAFLFYVDPVSWKSGLTIPGGPQFRVVCTNLVTATHAIQMFPEGK